MTARDGSVCYSLRLAASLDVAYIPVQGLRATKLVVNNATGKEELLLLSNAKMRRMYGQLRSIMISKHVPSTDQHFLTYSKMRCDSTYHVRSNSH